MKVLVSSGFLLDSRAVWEGIISNNRPRNGTGADAGNDIGFEELECLGDLVQFLGLFGSFRRLGFGTFRCLLYRWSAAPRIGSNFVGRFILLFTFQRHGRCRCCCCCPRRCLFCLGGNTAQELGSKKHTKYFPKNCGFFVGLPFCPFYDVQLHVFFKKSPKVPHGPVLQLCVGCLSVGKKIKSPFGSTVVCPLPMAKKIGRWPTLNDFNLLKNFRKKQN